MAEGEQRLRIAAGLSGPVAGLAHNRYVAFGLQWFGLSLTAMAGFVAALYYTISPEALRPIFDDSYISLNFARNLADHGKLSFDGEEWTTGATSPLHVMIMAVWIKLGVAPFYTSAAVGVVGHALLAAGVYCMAHAIFGSRLAGILGGLAIAFTSYAVLDAGNGLETTLFMTLIAFAVAAYFWSDKPAFRLACGVFIGLAVLTRPEGAVLIPAVAVFRWLERADGEGIEAYLRDVARLVAPGVAAGTLIVAFSLIVSGTLGGTGSAKMSFFQEDGDPLQYKLTVAGDQIGLFIGPILPLIALASVAAGRRAVLVFALFWVPVVLVYVYLFPGGLGHYFYRYQHPVLPFLAAFAGGGAAILIAGALKRDFVAKGLVVIALAIAVVAMYEQYNRWRDIYTMAATETHRDLEAMALDLNTIIQPDETLATHDIGAVQYFADYRVLDLVGLANEEVIPYHDGRRLREYMALRQPEYLLVFPDWDIFFLHLDTANLTDQYELVKVYEGGAVRRQPYVLYRVHYP